MGLVKIQDHDTRYYHNIKSGIYETEIVKESVAKLKGLTTCLYCLPRKRLWHRFKDLNKLSYLMNIAFGLSLLMITIQFQFGNTTIFIEEIPANITLGQGYITEPHLWIRVTEGLIAIGLIALGIERLKHYRRLK